jgi:hypothetical protein
LVHVKIDARLVCYIVILALLLTLGPFTTMQSARAPTASILTGLTMFPSLTFATIHPSISIHTGLTMLPSLTFGTIPHSVTSIPSTVIQPTTVIQTVTPGIPFDFTLQLSPSTVTVKQGESANFMVLLTYSDPSYAWTTVNIQITGLGPGMQYQLSTSGNLAIFTSPSTPLGTYAINVEGIAYGVYHQTSGTLILTAEQPAFDYSVTITPSTQTVALGKTATYTVTVALASGVGKTVTLSLAGLPADIQSSFSIPSGIPTYSSSLTVDTSTSTSTGTYTMTVTTSGDGLTKTAAATLTVKEEASDFSIIISPQESTVFQGESASFTVMVNAVGSFDQPITLIASGLPSGFSPGFAPASGKPPFTATLTIKTTSTTPTGSFKVTTDASGGGKSHSAIVTLALIEKAGTSPSTFDLATLLTSPSSLLIIIVALLSILIVTAARRRKLPAYQPSQATARSQTPQATAGFCENCGAPIKPGKAFCGSCGKPVE